MSNHKATGRPVKYTQKCSRAKGRDCWYWSGQTHLGFSCCNYLLCTGKSTGYAAFPTRPKKDEPPCQYYTEPKKNPPRMIVNDFQHEPEWYEEEKHDTTN